MKRRNLRRVIVMTIAVAIGMPATQAFADPDEDLGKDLKLLQQQLTDLQVQIRAIQDHLGVEPVQHAADPAAEADPEDKTPMPPGDAAVGWAKRADKDSLKESLAELEKRIAADPQDGVAYEWLSRGFYFLTDAHMRQEEDSDEKRDNMLASYKKGFDYAMDGMKAFSPKFKECLDLQDPVEDCVEHLPMEAAGPIYWYAVNLGKYAALDSFPTLLFYKAQIFALMQRLLALDEFYYYGAAHRYFGAYYSKAPAWAGGDMSKSKLHFEKALEIAPNYFSTSVLMADMYTRKTEDPDHFKRLLEFVINTDKGILTGLSPEQGFEQIKAENLLEEIDDIF
jgi:tetratricopeptide (TPR) repeat protein